MKKKLSFALTAVFLTAQAVLYWLILTAEGDTLRYSEYIAIVLCVFFAALHIKSGNRWLIAGLLCTLGADTCLVLLQPIRQLEGMVFFLAAQSFYAVALAKVSFSKPLLWLRLGLVAAAEIITVAVLGKNTDPLALVSLAYYAMLITNILVAFTQWKRSKLFPVALLLFLLCDTVIGLQVAATGYLPIAEGSALHRVLFSPFNLAWFFYLPSQVGIALRARRK